MARSAAASPRSAGKTTPKSKRASAPASKSATPKTATPKAAAAAAASRAASKTATPKATAAAKRTPKTTPKNKAKAAKATPKNKAEAAKGGERPQELSLSAGRAMVEAAQREVEMALQAAETKNKSRRRRRANKASDAAQAQPRRYAARTRTHRGRSSAGDQARQQGVQQVGGAAANDALAREASSVARLGQAGACFPACSSSPASPRPRLPSIPRTSSKKEKKAQSALSDDVLAQVAALEDDGEELDLSAQAGAPACGRPRTAPPPHHRALALNLPFPTCSEAARRGRGLCRNAADV